MITEPVAAALAFGVDRQPNQKKQVLVFDFGGGTHDVTILEIYKRMISVKAIEGDNSLGGQDIDIELMNLCLERFNDENGTNLCLKSAQEDDPNVLNNKQKARLRKECKQVKEALTGSTTQAEISIDNFH